METIFVHCCSRRPKTGFATSSSPWYFTTHAFFEVQPKNSATVCFNDEAAFSFGIGTLASDSLTIEAYQINELSETSIDINDPNPT